VLLADLQVAALETPVAVPAGLGGPVCCVLKDSRPDQVKQVDCSQAAARSSPAAPAAVVPCRTCRRRQASAVGPQVDAHACTTAASAHCSILLPQARTAAHCAEYSMQLGARLSDLSWMPGLHR
jgi:hypothetical protein